MLSSPTTSYQPSRRELLIRSLELSQERLRRAVKTDLRIWCTEALHRAGHAPAAHHRLLIRELEGVAQGHTKRLMVLMPPGSAKSTYASYLFPPFLMTRGKFNVLAASHTGDRAEYVSRQVQRYIRENRSTLGYGLASESVGQWSTTLGGEYKAAGVGVGIAGFRADIGLIDDPVKSREEADSEVVQGRIWDWYWSDFMTRLRPGSAQVLIMTRWAEGDLGGRLEEAEGQHWRIVRLPAIAEDNDPLGRAPGEWLWNDDQYGFAAKLKLDHEAFNRAGRVRDWTALYQQRPAPESGDYFRREWLHPVTTLPPRETMRIYGASDYAVTQDGGDYTVHIVVGMDPAGRIWVLDLWRGQKASDIWVDAFCDLVCQWKPGWWAEETGQIRSSMGPFLTRRQRERGAYVFREQFPTRADKAIRAQSIRGRMALHGLYYAADAPWRGDLEAELMSFPAGKHDDQVDALGLIGQLLDKMTEGKIPEDPKKDKKLMSGNADGVTMDDLWKLHDDQTGRARV